MVIERKDYFKMTEWENRFGQNALDKGKRLFLNGRVSDLKENNGNYTAAVLDRERFPVSLTIKEGKLVRGRCVCPLSKGAVFLCKDFFQFENRIDFYSLLPGCLLLSDKTVKFAEVFLLLAFF